MCPSPPNPARILAGRPSAFNPRCLCGSQLGYLLHTAAPHRFFSRDRNAALYSTAHHSSGYPMARVIREETSGSAVAGITCNVARELYICPCTTVR